MPFPIAGGNISKLAYDKADEASKKVDTFQTQIDEIVVEGDSSVEAAQARVDAEGNSYTTLKERLDTEHQSVTSQLAEKAPINSVDNKVSRKNQLFFIAHRGSSYTAPENTIPAFRHAIERGFQAIETDIRKTSDGEFVMIHNATVDGTTDGTGNVSDMTLTQIKALDAGSWFHESFSETRIPTFDEYLSVCTAGDVVPYIEIKGTFTTSDYSLMVDKIREHGLYDRAVMMSFDPLVLADIRSVTQDIRLIYISGFDNQILQTAKDLGNTVVNASASAITTEKVQWFRGEGVEVGCSKINDYMTIRDTINKGVYYFTTDLHLMNGGF